MMNDTNIDVVNIDVARSKPVAVEVEPSKTAETPLKLENLVP